MQRFIIFLIFLITFVGMYNASTLRSSFSGFFGDSSYQKNNLLDAEKYYENILQTYSGSNLLKADTLYNLGNTLYRLGEKEEDQKRIKLWQESIGNYTKSLALRTDIQTEENLAFVKEKLKQEEKKQEENKKEEQKTGPGSKQNSEKNTEWSGSTMKETESWQDEKTGSGFEKKETGTESEKETDKTQSGQNWSNGWSYNPIGWQNKDDINSNLSPADKQEVGEYLEQLKQFAKQNGKLLNPEKPWDIGNSISDQIRNFFWNDSFFQDMIPNDNGKKDW